MEIEAGGKVNIVSEKGTVYKVYRAEPWKDGSILLYGGDINPNGMQGFRSVMPDDVVPVSARSKRK